MNKARLEKLIVALEGVKPKQFDMASIAHGCNSPSCVLGHFASRRDLQRTFSLTEWGAISEVDGLTDPVLLDYFGIDEGQAYQLFDGEGCGGAKTPKQAQKFIRKFIDSDGAMR